MAFNNSLTIGADNFERLENGLWIHSTASADQPFYLRLKSTVNPSGNSSYLVRFEWHKNSPTVGMLDDVYSYHSVINVPLRAFTETEISRLIAMSGTFLSPSNLTRLLRGER